ncbi:hypothetical protein COOONC_00541 [Cooperia oncophora]
MAAIHGAAIHAIVPALSRIYGPEELPARWLVVAGTCRSGENNIYVPAPKGSFFAKSNLPESSVFALSYFWMRDMGKVNDKAYELEISHHSVVQWEQLFRDICVKYFMRNPPFIGAFGCTVEIDETLVTRRKHQWFFGGIERGSGRAFLLLVRRRDARSSWRAYNQISDSWRAYNQISMLPQAYWHLTVNHRLNFVDPQSGAHTQNVESLWQKYKQIGKRRYGIDRHAMRITCASSCGRNSSNFEAGHSSISGDQAAALYPC